MRKLYGNKSSPNCYIHLYTSISWFIILLIFMIMFSIKTHKSKGESASLSVRGLGLQVCCNLASQKKNMKKSSKQVTIFIKHPNIHQTILKSSQKAQKNSVKSRTQYDVLKHVQESPQLCPFYLRKKKKKTFAKERPQIRGPELLQHFAELRAGAGALLGLRLGRRAAGRLGRRAGAGLGPGGRLQGGLGLVGFRLNRHPLDVNNQFFMLHGWIDRVIVESKKTSMMDGDTFFVSNR